MTRNPFRKLYYKILSLKKNVGNLIKWFPIIWGDRDYDQVFLLDILQFKMKNMADLHRNHGYSVNSETYAEQLEECAFLAERIRDEDYEGEAFKGYEWLRDKHEVWFEENEEGHLTLTTSLTEDEDRLYMDLLQEQYEYMDRDIHLLFESMKRNIRDWWD